MATSKKRKVDEARDEAQNPASSKVPGNSKTQMESASSEMQIKPVRIEARMEPASSEVQIKPAIIETQMEPTSSEAQIKPTRIEAQMELVSSEVQIKPTIFETEMKPASSEAKIEPTRIEAQMGPASGEVQIMPTIIEAQMEPASSEGQINSLAAKHRWCHLAVQHRWSPVKTSWIKTYCVKYKNNSFKRWDGKTAMIYGESLHSVCNTSEVYCGDKVKLPWTAKKGKIQYWNAVVVDGMENGSCKQPKNTVAADNTKNAKSSPTVQEA